jgi:hypothetical protein
MDLMYYNALLLSAYAVAAGNEGVWSIIDTWLIVRKKGFVI